MKDNSPPNFKMWKLSLGFYSDFNELFFFCFRTILIRLREVKAINIANHLLELTMFWWSWLRKSWLFSCMRFALPIRVALASVPSENSRKCVLHRVRLRLEEYYTSNVKLSSCVDLNDGFLISSGKFQVDQNNTRLTLVFCSFPDWKFQWHIMKI